MPSFVALLTAQEYRGRNPRRTNREGGTDATTNCLAARAAGALDRLLEHTESRFKFERRLGPNEL
jgi:hypothetical protein